MAKSKSRNRKRSQILKQRKKERELLSQEDKPIGYDIIQKRVKKLGNFEIRKHQSKKIKISTVVSEMLEPLMEEARSIKEERNIIGMGITAWNLGVIKTYKGEEEMQKSLRDLKPKIPNSLLEILMEYVEIKCTKYKQYDHFIFDYEFTRINEHQNNLSVAYNSISELKSYDKKTEK